MTDCPDLVLIGGGLANSLIAYRLAETRPELDLKLIERADSLGGQHVWSFHDADLSSDQRRWLAPLVERAWPSYEVRFPGLRRTFESGYNSITSSRLDARVRQALGNDVVLDCPVEAVTPGEVLLGDGSSIASRAIVDGRGAVASGLDSAYQKFVGLHLELTRPHDLEGPILMDATVEQHDGFRFLYTLPFDRQHLLIEDTRYSDGPDLPRPEMRQQILAYAEASGWEPRATIGEEEGVLPIILSGDIEAFLTGGERDIPRSGMRAALFHPTTGYSLPEAVRLADQMAASEALSSRELSDMIGARSRSNWRRHSYFRLLNRMLFRAASPSERWRVMERFYRLSEPLIQRFYADRLTLGDRLRILSGKPPLSPLRALACLREPRHTASERVTR